MVHDYILVSHTSPRTISAPYQVTIPIGVNYDTDWTKFYSSFTGILWTPHNMISSQLA